MTATETILIRLKEWPQAELTRFACKLLILSNPKFHGSITLHYANGQPKKLIENVVNDI